MELEGTPVQHGYRMPAEWEPHSHCWMGWPVSHHLLFNCFYILPLILYILFCFWMNYTWVLQDVFWVLFVFPECQNLGLFDYEY